MKAFLLLIVCTLLFACGEKPRRNQLKENLAVSFIEKYRNDCKLITITFQLPNSKTSLVARKFDNKDSIDMVFSFIGNLIDDTTQICKFEDWGDIYFFKDTSMVDYFYDLYFSADQNCFLFQDNLNKSTHKYNMTEQGRLYINTLQKEYNFPD